MFHGALSSADVSYASPAVGAETLFELGHYGIEEGVDGGRRGAVLSGEADGDGIAAGRGLYAAEVGLADAYQIGAYGVVYLPHRVFAPVGVDSAVLQHAAAFGAPALARFYADSVGGLVIVIVAAWEHGATDGMQQVAKSGTEVICHVVVEVYAAETVVLHVAAAAVMYSECESLSGGDAVGEYMFYVSTREACTIDKHGVYSSKEIEANLGAWLQELHGEHGCAVERSAATEVESQVVVLHICRIGNLCLHDAAT